MATQPTTTTVAAPVSGPKHYRPPTARELRAQAVQRLQVGLFGLAAILLMIGLANIVIDRARLVDAASGVNQAPSPSAAATAPQPEDDPLADIGVVPAADPGATAQASPAPANAAPPQ